MAGSIVYDDRRLRSYRRPDGSTALRRQASCVIPGVAAVDLDEQGFIVYACPAAFLGSWFAEGERDLVWDRPL